MASELLPIYGIAKSLVKWLPGYFIRKLYPKQRLADLIYVDLLPRTDSARLQLAGAATSHLHVLLLNLSPFSVELDRARFFLNVLGHSLELTEQKRQSIEPGQHLELFLNGNVMDSQADAIANATDVRAYLSGHLEFNCQVHAFAKQLRHMDGVHLFIVNGHARKAA